MRNRYAEAALTNDMLRLVASAYLDLLSGRGQPQRHPAGFRRGPRPLINVTEDFADVKQGRQADADRARTEFDNRRIDYIEADAKIKTVSARLAELLNIEPSIRLHPVEERLVPMPIVPDPVPLPELLAIAMMQRPELAERRAVAVRQAFLELSGGQNAAVLAERYRRAERRRFRRRQQPCH